MKKKLTIQQKNRLLLAGAALACMIVYAYAVRPTIALHDECRGIQLQLDSSAGAPARMQQLQQELKELENNPAENNGVSMHEQLLDVVANYCEKNDLVLRDFAPPVVYRQQELIVETHPVKVEGNYIALLKLIRHLEKTNKGKVVSVDFLSKRDNKTQTLSLTATIYMQDIIKG